MVVTNVIGETRCFHTRVYFVRLRYDVPKRTISRQTTVVHCTPKLRHVRDVIAFRRVGRLENSPLSNTVLRALHESRIFSADSDCRVLSRWSIIVLSRHGRCARKNVVNWTSVGCLQILTRSVERPVALLTAWPLL